MIPSCVFVQVGQFIQGSGAVTFNGRELEFTAVLRRCSLPSLILEAHLEKQESPLEPLEKKKTMLGEAQRWC